MRSVSVFLAFVLCVPGCAVSRHAEGLAVLVEQGREEAAKEGQFRRDQASFERLRAALAEGALRRGAHADAVLHRFGEPVSVIGGPADQEWLYRARDWNWFAAPRIYLRFDREGRLDGWRRVGGERFGD